ncbi:MAG: sigma-70 family RNA polymerase sigma factor [Clostridia bacterium]|nr:sigma-70 family RNA polymerase sigma factor [Clostridia bacterium]
MLEIEKIYKQYQKTVYKYLMCLTKNSDIAEELTQETFYKMIKKINTYKGQASISVWLCEIAKNLWYDELRKNKKRNLVNEEEQEIVSNENIEENYIVKENALKVKENINKLDELTQRVLYLRLNSDLSFKEIGEILGKTETWARVTFYRGKQKVKEGDCYEE